MRARGPLVVLSSAWPGWTDAGTVIVPIDAAAWAPAAEPLVHAGRRFEAKHELHVTLVGRALGATVQAAIAAGRLREAPLADAYAAAAPWRLRRSGWRIALRKAAADAPPVESIIEPVALPAMARFHRLLGLALGQRLPVPPPHVTLYVAGDREGIGVPDAATLDALRAGAAWRA